MRPAPFFGTLTLDKPRDKGQYKAGNPLNPDTPEGRRKYRRVLAEDGRFAAALALTDGDFRHEITLDILYQLQIYTIFGPSYGAPGATPETRAAVEAAIAFLSGPDIPQPVAAYFKAEQQNFKDLP